jgi:glycine dehydrogenase subunit 1
LGIFATKQDLIRKIAGRLVGETVDGQGRRGYVLTLTAREQHIRREKATSNICSNQGLMALAVTVYLSLLGKHGLRQVAELCYHKAHYTAEIIGRIPGFAMVYKEPFFNEFVISCPQPVEDINNHLLDHGILGGYDLGQCFPHLNNHMLIAVTEMNTREEMDTFAEVLKEASND